ncbi:MAG TPA: ferrous iron transport protein B [Edaphocola sp.]|nr:ferrous iron transport protein B [Edaphocola sp.]
MEQKQINVALVGNPNSGKSSLFNILTGLKQKVGNFPGVTVDKKTGSSVLSIEVKAKIIDLPGTYSLYPKSEDEFVAYETLLNPTGTNAPDVTVVVADATILQRNLLFCSQIIDLGKPTIVALSMVDILEDAGSEVEIESISNFLKVPVILINPRKGKGLDLLKQTILEVYKNHKDLEEPFTPIEEPTLGIMEKVQKITKVASPYAALHLATANRPLSFISTQAQAEISSLLKENNFSKAKVQAEEVLKRYKKIDEQAETFLKTKAIRPKAPTFSEKLDKILLHKVWGNIALLIVLLILFQSIFWLAEFPMNLIDGSFSEIGAWMSASLPKTWWADLLVSGLWAGLGGVVVFIPQIAILFGLITILEDSGYMARITFLTDRLMRSVGMNGRASMPLISGLACAIPAIMATRIIENKKERLIAILVTPLMSCSARLPVYVILISLVIPNKMVLGFLSVQGLVMMALYFLGFFFALIVSKVLSWLIKGEKSGLFLMELPVYRAPRWKNAIVTMYEKSKIFVIEAGKIIMVISVILWGLGRFGPSDRENAIATKYEQLEQAQGFELTDVQLNAQSNEHLENSYLGLLGKAIEPAIRPLGYDWKIGIALLASFAAREAYVGTIATLYSLGTDVDENNPTLLKKMANSTWPDGRPIYNLRTGISLLVFYVFAMQCMSTLAIVKRETKTWKWPIIQFLYMSGLAYICALIAYNIF